MCASEEENSNLHGDNGSTLLATHRANGRGGRVFHPRARLFYHSPGSHQRGRNPAAHASLPAAAWLKHSTAAASEGRRPHPPSRICIKSPPRAVPFSTPTARIWRVLSSCVSSPGSLGSSVPYPCQPVKQSRALLVDDTVLTATAASRSPPPMHPGDFRRAFTGPRPRTTVHRTPHPTAPAACTDTQQQHRPRTPACMCTTRWTRNPHDTLGGGTRLGGLTPRAAPPPAPRSRVAAGPGDRPPSHWLNPLTPASRDPTCG